MSDWSDPYDSPAVSGGFALAGSILINPDEPERIKEVARKCRKAYLDDDLATYVHCAHQLWSWTFGGGRTAKQREVERQRLVEKAKILDEAVASYAQSQQSANELSKAQSPAEWGKVFGIESRIFVKRFNEGKIRGKKLSTKSYQVRLQDMPATKRQNFK